MMMNKNDWNAFTAWKNALDYETYTEIEFAFEEGNAEQAIVEHGGRAEWVEWFAWDFGD